MKAKELIEILKVIVENNPKAEVAATSDRLWLAQPGELSDKAQLGLTALGCGYDDGEGWYIFF